MDSRLDGSGNAISVQKFAENRVLVRVERLIRRKSRGRFEPSL